MLPVSFLPLVVSLHGTLLVGPVPIRPIHPSPELRGVYGALLDYVEAGWAILRPLQREAETILAWRRSHADPATAVAAYVDGDVTDEWRGIAFRCRDAVPGVEGATQDLAAYCPA